MHRRARLLAVTAPALAALAVTTAVSSPDSARAGTPVAVDASVWTSAIGLQADEGYPIDNATIVAKCERCHEQDDQGRMTRISYERKTPEGWQTTLRRMVALNNLDITAEEAREVVRYLANNQGLAPEELEPGLFEVERRLIDHVYEADRDVEFTCIQCHSMGRVITQRRTREEWELVLATHRGLYPLVDFQAFRRGGPPEPNEDSSPADARHPMDKAIDHLSAAFPLETPEWSAWKATMRAPRLAGTWLLDGYEPGKGVLYGSVTIEPGDADDEFVVSAGYTYPETGETVQSAGTSIVYTGHQWRGRVNRGETDELKQVMSVSRDWQTMTGRWFSGDYDERGFDVTLRRLPGAGTEAQQHVALGVYPRALVRGTTTEVSVVGLAPVDEIDFGPGVESTIERVEGRNGVVWVSARLSVAADAALGGRDLFWGNTSLAEAVIVHDGVDRLEVTPATGMARVGGANFPKGYQTYEAIGWNDGPDGEPDTDDDLRLGRVPVTWGMEEYSATFDDDDIQFVGSLGQDGVFTPNIDGPNPERRGSRNNVGDVWVVATHERGSERALRARAHLLVTVPLYMRFDPWQPLPSRLVP